MFVRSKKSRFSLEYAAITAVIVMALIGMRSYVRRAFSGRFRELSDQVGSQYDPQAATGTSTIVTTATNDEYMVYEDSDNDGENEYSGTRVHSVTEQTIDSTETIASPGS